MKATQFFLGFGPRLWSFRRGETEYGVRALPLGAFVRIIGMNNIDDVPPADEARTYRQKSYPRRMLVITAGSLMHLLIAIVLLFTVYSRPRRARRACRAPRSARRRPSGPAADAGLRDGRRHRSSSTARPSTAPTDLGDAVRSHEPGDVVDVVVERDGERADRRRRARREHRRGQPDVRHGAASASAAARPSSGEEMSLGEAAVSSVTDLFPTAWESTKGVVQVLNPVNIFEHLSGENDDLATRPTTVVGITQVSGDDRRRPQGFVGVLYLLAVAQRVRRRVQHVPAAAARRRARRDRHLRAAPRARRPALLRRRVQADAVRHGRDRRAAVAVHVRALPRHHPDRCG